ncbi:protein of unknown function [Blastococcus saxobsidens DD2]|uniref:Resolvase/invertase-type recombinase catalytic domain-containing protein n=1 Tax=Blastococcus saxobsidens (strain DD2) TaxID=1146883 RepID=H6RRL1_BLASD|nr:protein of unknown function [Blastococcus saxobsidens DD2]
MTALLIGYARVSTDAHDLTAQREGLLALGVDPGDLRRLRTDRHQPRTPRAVREVPESIDRWPGTTILLVRRQPSTAVPPLSRRAGRAPAARTSSSSRGGGTTPPNEIHLAWTADAAGTGLMTAEHDLTVDENARRSSCTRGSRWTTRSPAPAQARPRTPASDRGFP